MRLRMIGAGLVTLVMAACTSAPLPAPDIPLGASADLPAAPVQRCINLGNALEAPRGQNWGYTIRGTDLDRIAAAGFDTVRIPVRWSGYASDNRPYTIEADIFETVDTVAREALARNLKVIINVHHYGRLMRDDNPLWQDRLAGIWRQLASHYANWPDTLMFELVNEPHGKMNTRRTDDLIERLLPIVRQHNPRRWVIAGGADWNSLRGLLASDLPDDPRMMLTFHYYEPFNFTHQGASWVGRHMRTGVKWGTPEDAARVRDDLAAASEFAAKRGQALLLGEFGVYEAVPVRQRATWTEWTRKLAEHHGIGWCYWDWAGSFEVYDTRHEEWRSPIANALDVNWRRQLAQQ